MVIMEWADIIGLSSEICGLSWLGHCPAQTGRGQTHRDARLLRPSAKYLEAWQAHPPCHDRDETVQWMTQ